VVHALSGPDGAAPVAGLVKAQYGHFYGTTLLGGASGWGTVFRVRMPAVTLTVNGVRDRAEITFGNPLEIAISLDTAGNDTLAPAEIYVGVVDPTYHLYFLRADGTFGTARTPLYSGPLPSFGATPVVHIADVNALGDSIYSWVVVVDRDSNGIPDGHLTSLAHAIIRRP